MGRRQEFQFAEVIVDRLLLESFPNERSAYHLDSEEAPETVGPARFHTRLRWHINNSLSRRQRQVMRQYLSGRKEREIAHDLGITQQVVNIYKHRAIKRLQDLFSA